MKPVTAAQLGKIHLLLLSLDLLDQKASFVSQFTSGRETSSKGMKMNEAANLIMSLEASDPTEKMRKKVFALAYESGFIYGETPDDKKMNSAKLLKFILEKGTVKKHLNKMTKSELVKTLNQWEQFAKHTHINKSVNAAKTMLAGLGITTSKTAAK